MDIEIIKNNKIAKFDLTDVKNNENDIITQENNILNDYFNGKCTSI